MVTSVRPTPVRLKKGLRGWLTALPFILPGLVLVTAFVLYPLLFTVRIALSDYQIVLGKITFLGLDNFRKVLSGGSRFWYAYRNNFLYALVTVPFILLGGMLFAYLINGLKKGQSIFRVGFYLPVITSWVIVSLVFQYILAILSCPRRLDGVFCSRILRNFALLHPGRSRIPVSIYPGNGDLCQNHPEVAINQGCAELVAVRVIRLADNDVRTVGIFAVKGCAGAHVEGPGVLNGGGTASGDELAAFEGQGPRIGDGIIGGGRHFARAVICLRVGAVLDGQGAIISDGAGHGEAVQVQGDVPVDGDGVLPAIISKGIIVGQHFQGVSDVANIRDIAHGLGNGGVVIAWVRKDRIIHLHRIAGIAAINIHDSAIQAGDHVSELLCIRALAHVPAELVIIGDVHIHIIGSARGAADLLLVVRNILDQVIARLVGKFREGRCAAEGLVNAKLLGAQDEHGVGRTLVIGGDADGHVAHVLVIILRLRIVLLDSGEDTTNIHRFVGGIIVILAERNVLQYSLSAVYSCGDGFDGAVDGHIGQLRFCVQLFGVGSTVDHIGHVEAIPVLGAVAEFIDIVVVHSPRRCPAGLRVGLCRISIFEFCGGQININIAYFVATLRYLMRRFFVCRHLVCELNDSRALTTVYICTTHVCFSIRV